MNTSKSKSAILLLSIMLLMVCIATTGFISFGKVMNSGQSVLPNEYRWIVGEWHSFYDYPGDAIITPEYIQYETDGDTRISQKHKYSIVDSYIVVDGKQVFSLDEVNKTISYDYIIESEGFDGPVNIPYTVEFDKIRNILLDEAVIKAEDYDFVDEFHNGVALINKGDRYGLINTKNQLVVPCVYKAIMVNQYADGLLPTVSPENHLGYVDLTGKIRIPFSFDDISEDDWGPAMFNNGYAIASMDDKWGIINKSGEFVVPRKYGQIFNTNVGLYGVVVGQDYSSGKIGFIDIKGNEVIPCIYECWHSDYEEDKPPFFFTFSDGIIALAKDGKYGCVNTDGKIVLPFTYDYIGEFVNEIAMAYKGGKQLSIVAKSGKAEEVQQIVNY